MDLKQYNTDLVAELFSPKGPIEDTVVFKEVRQPKLDHGLTIAQLEGKKINLYYYDDHIKCRNALQSFAKSFKDVEFIPINRKTEIQYDGIPVIWGNKNESKSLIHQCWAEHIDFFHLDLPLIENWGRKSAADAIRTFRLSINALHKNRIYPRTNDRLDYLIRSIDMPFKDWKYKRNGVILVCPPSEPMAEFFDISIDAWLDQTVQEIKANSDLPYRVRFKPTHRVQRTTLIQDLEDTACMVTFNSNAGVESIFNGVPVISHEISATGPISIDYDEINLPPTYDRTAWASSIAYSQWNMDELSNGLALRYLLEEYHLYRDPPKL